MMMIIMMIMIIVNMDKVMMMVNLMMMMIPRRSWPWAQAGYDDDGDNQYSDVHHHHGHGDDDGEYDDDDDPTAIVTIWAETEAGYAAATGHFHISPQFRHNMLPTVLQARWWGWCCSWWWWWDTCDIIEVLLALQAPSSIWLHPSCLRHWGRVTNVKWRADRHRRDTRREKFSYMKFLWKTIHQGPASLGLVMVIIYPKFCHYNLLL